MLDKNIKPIDQYQSPSMLARIGAAVLDLAMYIVLSFLILTVGGLFIGKEGTSFTNANNLISEQIKYSKLAREDEKNGFVAFSGNELLELDANEDSLVITNVAYFYCAYLTGINVENGLQASIDVNEQIKADNGYYLAKDYYTSTKRFLIFLKKMKLAIVPTLNIVKPQEKTITVKSAL